MFRYLLLCAALAVPLAVADNLTDLEDQADEVVHVDINAATLRALARATPRDSSDEARFVEALEGVHEIRIVSLEFHGGGMPEKDDIAAVRAAAVRPGWSQFLRSRSHDPEELVEGYQGPGGLAIVTAEKGEITSVYIDGAISSEVVPLLGGHFGLPTMGGGEDTPKFATRGGWHELGTTARPQKLDFGHMVHRIEADAGIRHMHIPLMGLIKPAAFMVTGGKVRALDFAIFEDAPRSFVQAADRAAPEGWSRMVEVREGKEATNIYVGAVDERMPLLIANWDGNDGVLLTVKAKLEDFTGSPLEWDKFGWSKDDEK